MLTKNYICGSCFICESIYCEQTPLGHSYIPKTFCFPLFVESRYSVSISVSFSRIKKLNEALARVPLLLSSFNFL